MIVYLGSSVVSEEESAASLELTLSLESLDAVPPTGVERHHGRIPCDWLIIIFMSFDCTININTD